MVQTLKKSLTDWLMTKRLFYRWHFALKDRWPVVWKSTYDRMVEMGAQQNGRTRDLWEAKYNEACKKVDELVPKLFRYTLERSARYDRPMIFRVLVELDEQMVYDCFIHGNDRRAIDFLCERFYQTFRRELSTINFARFRERPDFDRERQGRWNIDELPSPYARGGNGFGSI